MNAILKEVAGSVLEARQLKNAFKALWLICHSMYLTIPTCPPISSLLAKAESNPFEKGVEWIRLPFVDVVHAPSIRVDIEALHNLTEVVTVLKLAELDVCPT